MKTTTRRLIPSALRSAVVVDNVMHLFQVQEGTGPCCLTHCGTNAILHLGQLHACALLSESEVTCSVWNGPLRELLEQPSSATRYCLTACCISTSKDFFAVVSREASVRTHYIANQRFSSISKLISLLSSLCQLQD